MWSSVSVSPPLATSGLGLAGMLLFFFTGLKNVRGYHEGFNQDYKGYPKTKPDNISGSTYLHVGSENIKLKEWSPRGKGTSG